MERQFPDNITSTITLYSQWEDPLTGLQILVRQVLHGVYWSSDSEVIRTQSGINTTMNAAVMIPYRESVTGRQFLPAEEWRQLSRYDIEAMTIQPYDNVFDLTEDTPEVPDPPDDFAIGDKIRNVSDKTITVGGAVMPPGDFGRVTSLEPFIVNNKKYWSYDPRNYPYLMNYVNEHEFFWAHPSNTAITPANDRLAAQISRFTAANPNVYRAVGDNPFLIGSERMRHIVLRV